MSGQSCTFTSGDSTVTEYCAKGCCTDGCCSDTSLDSSTLAIIIIAVIVGLILLLLLVLLIWWLLRRRKEKEDKKPLTKKKDVESGKKKKKKAVVSGRAVTSPPPTKHKKKLKPRAVVGGVGGNNKMTQTVNHRYHHGDILMATRRKWVGFEDNDLYDDYLQREDVQEVGVCTDGKGAPSKLKNRNWKATANAYTRRESLRDDYSSDDESLGPYMVDETTSPSQKDSSEGQGTLVVNAYGYAAKDVTKKKKKNDYVLKDEKLKTAVKAWENVNPPWQYHSKNNEAAVPQQETKAQKQWKDTLLKVQTTNEDGSKKDDGATKMEQLVRAMQPNKGQKKDGPANNTPKTHAVFVKPANMPKENVKEKDKEKSKEDDKEKGKSKEDLKGKSKEDLKEKSKESLENSKKNDDKPKTPAQEEDKDTY